MNTERATALEVDGVTTATAVVCEVINIGRVESL